MSQAPADKVNTTQCINLNIAKPHHPTHHPLPAKLLLLYNHPPAQRLTNMPPRPPISPEKRKERYLEAVRDKMAKLYAYGEAKPPAREQLWHEITGFLKAGELLSDFTTEELQAIIDEEHITAFGITREERQLKQKLATTDDEQDWDKYDVPPKMR